MALWIVVLLALALRVFQAVHHPFTPDELAVVKAANDIRLAPPNTNYVLSSHGHPLLTVYLSHLGALVFGKTELGYRAATAILGAGTTWVVYQLGRDVGGRTAGLWAALLLAVDQFHTTLSGSVDADDVGVIFFGALALLTIARLRRGSSFGRFAILGVWVGFAYLSKETALILFPVLWLFVLLRREGRAVLTDWRWYGAHCVFLLIISPDLWSIATTGGWVQLSTTKVLSGNDHLIQGKAVSLFLGEVLMWVKPDILGGENGYWCWPLRTVHWVAGVAYIAAVAVTLRSVREPAVLLAHLCFWIPVGVVTLMPGKEVWDPFWWASMAIVPAVVLTGTWIDRVCRSRPSRYWVVVPLVIWLLARTILEQNSQYCYPGTLRVQPLSANSPR